MADQIKLADGEETTLTFQYDNVTRARTRPNSSGDSWVYYTFTCEEGRYGCNNHCVRQIQQAWPGKGGSIHIKRWSASAYEITDVVMGEGGDMKMVAFKEGDNRPSEIPFDLDGLAEAAPVDKPAPAKGAQAASEVASALSGGDEGHTMEDMVDLQFHCFRETMCNWNRAEKDNETEFSGDTAGAIQRAAVSLFIECAKRGIVGMPQPSEAQAEDDGVDRSGSTGGPNTPEGVNDPGHGEPPPEDEDGLPF